jgi:hypothetical protein
MAMKKKFNPAKEEHIALSIETPEKVERRRCSSVACSIGGAKNKNPRKFVRSAAPSPEPDLGRRAQEAEKEAKRATAKI